MSQNSFVRSLRISRNVIGALMMREIITRYGRKNFGFIWMIIEPVLFSVLISIAWTVKGTGRISGVPVLEFLMTGFPLLNLWRGCASRAIGAIEANAGLLFHSRVRLLDVFIARLLVDAGSATISYIVILILFYFTGYMSAPFSVLYMIIAWIMMVWFGFGLGLILGSLTVHSDVLTRLWRASGMVLMMISGTFFLVRSLPPMAQKWALYVPMVHGSEMLRHGFFGDKITTYENIVYLLIVNLSLTFVGLVLIQRYKRGVEQ